VYNLARQGQAEEFEGRSPVFSGFRIAPGGYITPLHRAYSRPHVKLGRQFPSGMVILLQVGQESLRVDKHRVRADRFGLGI
jgi:hypothetical protein